jgi:YegS/Rv2252/BmrU family lipid kinase
VKRYAFIYNPAARGGKSGSNPVALEQCIGKLSQAKLFRSKSKGDIAEIVEQRKTDFDVFVACGGDGTIREIASNLVSTPKTMGIIPMGTGNDLCKTLKIPRNLQKSFEILLNGNSIRMDIGRCNDHIFLNSLGFGFDGLTNRYTLEIQKLPSFLKYSVAALKAAIYQNPFNVQIKGNNSTVDERLIMVTLANGKVEGGAFWIAPEASVTDGKLDFITITPIKKWLIPILLPLFLMKKPNWIPHLKSIKLDNVQLKFDNNIEIHADGEIIKTNQNKFTISLLSNELQVICGL